MSIEANGLTMRAWLERAIKAYDDRLVLIDIVTAWPDTPEATDTLDEIHRSGMLTDEELASITSERVARASRGGYMGLVDPFRARLLNGVITNLHRADKCWLRPGGCWLHRSTPADQGNALLGWPVEFVDGRAWRVCRHFAGHPDIDDAAFWLLAGVDLIAEHRLAGCDGCCRPRSPGASRSPREADGGAGAKSADQIP